MRPYLLRTDDPAILVSDIHYPASARTTRLIITLTEEAGAETLVILGDLFDDLHRPLSREELQAGLARVFRGMRDLRAIFVTSRSSHDPILNDAMHFKSGSVEWHVYPGPVVARLGATTAFLTHGDLALRNGAQAFLINFLMKSLGEELFLEKKLKQKLCLPNHWWLFMGHTHIPGIDYESRVANTGSWRSEWVGGLPYWRPPSNTYLVVEDGRVELRQMVFKEREGGCEAWPRRSVQRTLRRSGRS